MLKILIMNVCLICFYNCNGSTHSNQVNSCLDETACNYMDDNSCLYKDCEVFQSNTGGFIYNNYIVLNMVGFYVYYQLLDNK